MSCYSLKCLKCMVFCIALTILILGGIGPIVVGIVYRNSDLVDSLNVSMIFLITSISLGALIIIFSLCGICGACKANRYCLCWYFIFMLFCFVFSGALLALYIYLNSQGQTMLENFCSGTGIFSGADSLKNYDNIAKNLGSTGNMCYSGTCGCKLPGNANYMVKYKNHDDTGTESTMSLTHDGAGVMNVQECTALFDTFTSTAKSFVHIMKPIEEKYTCSGICIKTNIMPSFNTTNAQIGTNYDAGQNTSCFQKLIDEIKSNFVIGISFFSALTAVCLFAIIFTCCICYHDEVKSRR